MATPSDILITGGTGYIGQHVIPLLIARGHRVRVVARQSSLARVPAGAAAGSGGALHEDSLARAFGPGGTGIHLVGPPHPSPAKAGQVGRVHLVAVPCTGGRG